MPEQYQDFTPLLAEFNTKLRDLEEKQKLLKERVLLIGKNLIESKEILEKNIIELKISSEETKREIEKLKSTLLSVLEELEKRARKSELEILQKQAKMFQPLEMLKK